MRRTSAPRSHALADRAMTTAVEASAGDRRQALSLLTPVTALLLAGFVAPLTFVLFRSVYDDGFTLHGFSALAASGLFWRVLGNSFQISLIASVVSLLAGYPVALHLARQPPRRRALLLVLVLVPFWTSILVKSFAFMLILGSEGIVNRLLVAVFGDAARSQLLFNRIGVIVALTHNLVPYVVFPVLASLLAQDRGLARAAQVMGAGPVRIFWRITLPLSMPGVAAALLMAMVISMGVFVIPALLGGRHDIMIANLVDYYTRETLDWNAAASIAVVLLLISTCLTALLTRVRGEEMMP